MIMCGHSLLTRLDISTELWEKLKKLGLFVVFRLKEKTAKQLSEMGLSKQELSELSSRMGACGMVLPRF